MTGLILDTSITSKNNKMFVKYSLKEHRKKNCNTTKLVGVLVCIRYKMWSINQ